MQFSLGFYLVGLVLVCSSHAFADRYAEFKVEMQEDSIELELRVGNSVGREFTWWILEIEDSSSEFMQVISYRKPHESINQLESSQDFISKWSGKLGVSYGNIILYKGTEYKAHLFMGNSYSDENYTTSSSVVHSSLRFSLQNNHLNFNEENMPHIRFLQDSSSTDTSSDGSTNSSDTSGTDSSDTSGTTDSSDTSGTTDSSDTSGTSNGSDGTDTSGGGDSSDTSGTSDGSDGTDTSGTSDGSDGTDTSGTSNGSDGTDTSDTSNGSDTSDPIPNQSGSSGSYKPDPNEDLTSAYSENTFLRWVPGGQDLKGDSGLHLTIVNIFVLVVILIH